MRRVLKWTGLGLGAMFVIALCAAAYVYVGSELIVARTYDVPLTTFRAPRDAAAVDAGRRLATIYGCNNCHAAHLNGTVLWDKPGIARITAPNVSRIALEYSDAELERLIRRGVKRDGTSTWIMPAQMFSHLTDEDLGNIIAWVRSMPAVDGVAREMTLRPLGRIGLVLNEFKPVAAQVDRSVPAVVDRANPLSHGRYLVMSACTECHGAHLEGMEIVQAPGLIIAAAYSRDELTRLLRTGVGKGERKLGLMAEVARDDFSHFTDEEIAAIHNYLKERADRAP